MKNTHENEHVVIKLEVHPSFGSDLIIKVADRVITYHGNLMLEHIYFVDKSGEITISSSDFYDLIGDLKRSQISIIPKFIRGLDGTTYTLSFGNGRNMTRYVWLEKCPKGWEELGKLVDRLIRYTRKMVRELEIAEQHPPIRIPPRPTSGRQDVSAE